MTIYKFKGYTLCQSDDWRYSILNEKNEVIMRSISSVPLAREEAERAVRYAMKGDMNGLGLGLHCFADADGNTSDDEH